MPPNRPHSHQVDPMRKEEGERRLHAQTLRRGGFGKEAESHALGCGRRHLPRFAARCCWEESREQRPTTHTCCRGCWWSSSFAFHSIPSIDRSVRCFDRICQLSPSFDSLRSINQSTEPTASTYQSIQTLAGGWLAAAFPRRLVSIVESNTHMNTYHTHKIPPRTCSQASMRPPLPPSACSLRRGSLLLVGPQTARPYSRLLGSCNAASAPPAAGSGGGAAATAAASPLLPYPAATAAAAGASGVLGSSSRRQHGSSTSTSTSRGRRRLGATQEARAFHASARPGAPKRDFYEVLGEL